MMGEALLAAQDVRKEFGSGRTLVRAVNGVDLSVASGEICLVMGPSGSGKTTLLTLIGGLLQPSGGTVTIGGTEITALRRSELARVRRSLVGFVFQTFNLLESLSAIENVEIALNIAQIAGREAHERARGLLVEAGLEERIDFKARDLSGGEKQRVSIARALANEPPLLLADEPTANLDSRHGREVMELLRLLAKERDRAAVVVSHDERLRGIADSTYWMEDGRLSPGDPGAGIE